MPNLNQVQYRLSGGASNTDPTLSIGGLMSSQAVGPDLFDRVDSLAALRGQTEYRCVYVRNAGPDALPVSSIYVTSPNPIGRIALGLGAVGQSEPQVANDGTAPTGVVFGGQSINTPVEVPALPAGAAVALWLRRTVQQRAQAGEEAFEVALAFSGSTAVAPTITVTPAITGTPTEGQPITGTQAAATGDPTPTITYELLLNDVVALSSVTLGSTTYPAGSVGNVPKLRATATNSQGSATATSAAGPAIAAAPPTTVAPTITVAPAITGTPRQGQAITFSAASATGTPSPTLAYDLLLNDVVALTGITSGVTLYPAGSSGQVPKIRATASNGTAPNAVATSAAGPAVAAPFTAPAFTSPPAITGTPTEGQPITGTAAVATGNPTPAVTYELLLDDVVALSSVTLGSTAYPAGSSGKVPKLRATATNSQGSATSTSAAGPAVVAAPVAPSFTANPVILGTPTAGQSVSWNAATATGNPAPTITYFAELDGVEGGTAVTSGAYTLPSDSAGKTLRIVARAANGVSPNAVAFSAPVTVQAAGPAPGAVTFSGQPVTFSGQAVTFGA